MAVFTKQEILNLNIDHDNLPILNIGTRIGNRIGNIDYIDFISYDEVSEPIMWFRDCLNRRGIVLKIEGKNSRYTGTMVLFQMHAIIDKWTIAFGNSDSTIKKKCIELHDLENANRVEEVYVYPPFAHAENTIHIINSMINGNHPLFCLAQPTTQKSFFNELNKLNREYKKELEELNRKYEEDMKLRLNVERDKLYKLVTDHMDNKEVKEEMRRKARSGLSQYNLYINCDFELSQQEYKFNIDGFRVKCTVLTIHPNINIEICW